MPTIDTHGTAVTDTPTTTSVKQDNGALTPEVKMLSLEIEDGLLCIPRGARLHSGGVQKRRQVLLRISGTDVLLMSRTDGAEYHIGDVVKIHNGCLELKIPVTVIS